MLKENLGQLNTHTPTTGKLPRGTLKVWTQKTQTGQRAFHLCLVVVGTHQLETLMLMCELFHQRHIALTFIICAFSQLSIQLRQSLLHLRMMRESLARFLSHGSMISQFQHLRQIADCGIVGYRHCSCRRLFNTTKYFQQRWLACSILTDKSYPVFVVDDKAGISKQRFGTELYFQVFYGNHLLCLLYKLQNYSKMAK